METRPRHPANSRVRDSQAAAAADGDIILGRARIAAAAGKSPRTITRWFAAGRLNAAKAGEAKNTMMYTRAAEIRKAR